ncbi:MAG: DUF4335 domain-containing protein [Coleofasciculus sp. S288]|nr:DUF4335 domain-containing protein [Coleofasciculus sp. S288]
MPLSNSVLRRYTPPTCTLEIVAKSSPLSRWTGQTVLKNLRFELRFDDPRKPEDNRVTIRGDRTELEMLCDAVNSYVQDFLDSSSTQLPLVPHTPVANSMPDDDPSGEPSALPASGITYSQSLATEASGEETDNSASLQPPDSNSKLLEFKPRTHSTAIHLKPKGLLSHNLFLGQLANEESGPAVALSVLQLFDLATALDEYAAEVIALPNFNRFGLKKAPPAWTWAAVALLAVGVTTTGVKLLNQSQSTQVATTAEEQESSAAVQPSPPSQLPLAPASPLPTGSPLPTPLVPSPLSGSSQVLPPPTPVTVPPTPTQSAPSSPAANQPPILTISPQERKAVPSKPVAPAQDPTRIAAAPPPPTPSTNSSPSPSGTNQAQRSTSGTPATPFPLPKLPPLGSTSPANQIADEGISQSATRSGAVPAAMNSEESAPTTNARSGKLFDTIPQVAEVRDYLQQRWQPPSGLTQTLEYSLLLNADGSIQRIIPLGKAAGDYIDNTAIPRPGQPFVSAVEGQRNPNIRVVLKPDGEVETFLESQ